MLPFALLGLAALALSLAPAPRRARGDPDRLSMPAPDGLPQADGSTPPTLIQAEGSAPPTPTPDQRTGQWRRDPRLAGLLVFGGWFLVEGGVLSLSKGIVHPYYVSALGPGAAAMVGVGAAAWVELARRPNRCLALVATALLLLAVAATALAQMVLLHRAHYLSWLPPAGAAAAAIGVGAFLVLRRRAAPAMTFILGALLLAPGAYATTTWKAPVEGTFPAVGPQQAAGYGGLDVSPTSLRTYRSLLRYVATHQPGTRWAILTEASDTAAPLILLGLKAGALAGYSATDPALDGAGLARLVARGEARYLVLGGAYSSRGGNLASKAVAQACAKVPPRTWRQTHFTRYSLVLFDCAGRERELAGA